MVAQHELWGTTGSWSCLKSLPSSQQRVERTGGAQDHSTSSSQSPSHGGTGSQEQL